MNHAALHGSRLGRLGWTLLALLVVAPCLPRTAHAQSASVITQTPDPNHPILQQAFQDAAARATRRPLTAGNRFELLENGVVMISRRLVRRLRRGGVKVVFYNPWIDWIGRRYRQHRKMVVADFRQAIVGGMNLADAYNLGDGWPALSLLEAVWRRSRFLNRLCGLHETKNGAGPGSSLAVLALGRGLPCPE